MQFIQEIPPLNFILLKKITEKVNEDSQSFQPSLLYDTLKKDKIFDESERISEFKLIRNPELFNLIDQYVTQLPTSTTTQSTTQSITTQSTSTQSTLQNKNKKYHVVHNDITYIRYKKDGFFKPHEDFLTYMSSGIEEYTLVLCLDANCEGGETILHLNPYHKHISKSSIQPGHSLIFRKDIRHEGNKLESGYKHILTVNLLLVEETAASKIVVVNFPNESENIQKCQCFISLKNIKKIPNNKIFNSMYMGKQAPFYSYDEINMSSHDFQLVMRIFDGKKLTNSEFLKHYLLLESYGFDKSVILASVSAVEIPTKIKNTCWIEKEDFVVFSKREAFLHQLEKVKTQKLPWIPFKTFWIEGSLSIINEEDVWEFNEDRGLPKIDDMDTYDFLQQHSDEPELQDHDDTHYDMQPLVMTCSESNNVLFIKYINKNNTIRDDEKDSYYNIEPNRDKLLLNYFEGYDKYIQYKTCILAFDKLSQIIPVKIIQDIYENYISQMNFDFQQYDFDQDMFYLQSRDDDCWNDSDDEDNPCILLKRPNDNVDPTISFIQRRCSRMHNYSFHIELISNTFKNIFENLFFLELGSSNINNALQFQLSPPDNQIEQDGQNEQREFYTIEQSSNKLILNNKQKCLLGERIKKIDLIKQLRETIKTIDPDQLFKQQNKYGQTLCNETSYGNFTVFELNGFIKMK